jgi:hypothetical protein
MASYRGGNMRDFSMTDNQSKTGLEIFYQNIRGLRTKQTELFDNVCSMYFQIICLTETWLNDTCFDHKLFPDSYTIFRSDRVNSNKSRGAGVLTAVSSRVRSFKRRYDLQFYEECVWVEISTKNGRSPLIGNHYFPPDIKPELMSKYLCSLEKPLDTRNHYVFLIGDFNVPNFDWERSLPLSNCYFYSILKGNVIYTSTSLLGLTQRLLTDSSLDLVFTNFDRVGTFFADEGVVKPDAYHPPIVIEIPLDLHISTSYARSYRKYASGDYSLLFRLLFNYDWSCVYSNNTVEAAVDSFTNVILQAMDLANPPGSQ